MQGRQTTVVDMWQSTRGYAIQFLCDGCGGKVTTRYSHFLRKETHFCSTPCYALYRKQNYGSDSVELELLKLSKFLGEGTDDCIFWLGHKINTGYGVVNRKGVKLAHRYLYELIVDKIPDGLTLDHLCRNKICVNPMHLEPVTLIENLRRGNSVSSVNARKSTCIRGHLFDYFYKGARHCKTCRQMRRIRYATNAV